MKHTFAKLAYEAPETSVDWIEQERCFVATTGTLQDMDKNSLFEDEFDED